MSGTAFMSKKYIRCFKYLLIFIGLTSLLSFIFLISSFDGTTKLGQQKLYDKDDNKNLLTSFGYKTCENEEKDENLLCLIVPFRDRFDELLVFVPHMKNFLCNQRIKNEIIVVNQQGNYRFNRGSLINIGYLISSKQFHCNYFAMHDVDLMPLNGYLSYSFPHQPFHISAPDLHPKYHYEKFIGGIFLINNFQYEMVNGISNLFWGWGREDDEFYLRLKEANLEVFRPQNITTGQKTFLHLHDKSKRLRDNIRFGDQKSSSRRRDRKTGLKDTRYALLSSQSLSIDGYLANVFNVELPCDVHVTPWCMTITQLKLYVKEQQNILPPVDFEQLLEALSQHRIKL